MGLLRRKSADGLTADLENLRHRRSQLDALLVAAEQRLDEATRDRQAKLLESDLANDGPPTSAIILRLTDERDACIDALAAVDAKAADVQRRLDEARDRAKREAAARELNGVTDELTKLADDYAAVVSRLPAMLAGVIDKLPQAVVSKSHTEIFANEVVAALRLVVSEARSHAAQIVSGNAQICEPVAQQPVKPPAPEIARQEVFLRRAGKWSENGEIVTSGPRTTPALPLDVAHAAVEFGHAVPFPSAAAAALRAVECPDYSYWPPDRCADLTQPASPPRGAQETAATLPVHSEFTPRRKPIIGTAIAR
jgi:hypothetical protein